ncbi:uncharacterized protein LAESUDRAFT_673600 [Laetiporus sulphureus 93-53]|uniref:Polynucleotide 5'-hydroxyl-kinase GRC3 n=1 Tax=Laetiporus sulphureus 93-53 TaxID=1314785 RepID=A0A165G7K0_9APHY|nr:uncharacterized protein LAESUDRAFT_673600 [Laetiporus sulphureus 93-53]KZT09937.1 hypothetical protein LAESUDRAFT_673600 [Laetiporus sulphureus 93-53]
MLSAIAARKARLASQTKTNPASTEALETATISIPLKAPATPKQSPKRDAIEKVAEPPKKKTKLQPRNARNAQQSRARYFQEDAFQTQEDVIDLSDGDSSNDSDISSETVDISTQDNTVPSQSRKRAWSSSAPLRDSSDEDDEVAETGEEATSLSANVYPPSPSVPSPFMSTFAPVIDQNVFYLTAEEVQALLRLSQGSERSGTMIVLLAGETLALLGTYAFTVLQARIALAGVVLDASDASYHVFAPRSSPIPIIEGLPSIKDTQDCVAIIPQRIKDSIPAGATVILLQELRTGVEGLGFTCRTFKDVFSPSPSQRLSPLCDLQLHGVHLLSTQTHGISSFVMPRTWESAMASVLAHSCGQGPTPARNVFLVKGPRNAGKSTFAKILMNRLLTKFRRIAFLECDIGQSEFTPGGMVALSILDRPVFGPPFSHPSIPHAAHYVGANSPRSSPSHYVESVQALIQTYNFDIQQAALEDSTDARSSDGRIADVIPLVVNTMGWAKGLGASLTKKIEEMVEPSGIFEFTAREEHWNTAPPRIHDVSPYGCNLHRLEPIPSSAISNHFTAADHRILTIMSYFHAIFPMDTTESPFRNITATSWNTSDPLCAQLPYEVEVDVAFDSIVLAGAGMEDVIPSEVHHVLNGAIVGLIGYEPGTLDTDPDDALSGSLPYKQGAPPPSPCTSRCCGLAIIRSLSPSSQVLHLLTPLPPYVFASARVLLKGEFELPVWAMLDFRSGDKGDVAGVESSKVPFLRWGRSEGAGGERRRVRRNLMRRGQM